MSIRNYYSHRLPVTAYSIANIGTNRASQATSIANNAEFKVSEANSIGMRAESMARLITSAEFSTAKSIAMRAESLAEVLDSTAIKSIPSSGEQKVYEIVRDPDIRTFLFKWESVAQQ